MFPTGKKFRFFAIFLMMTAAILIGCDGGDGGNNDGENDGIGALDNAFGNAGVLLVEAQGQEIISAEQDAKNQQAQVENQQRKRELQFVNRFDTTTLRNTFRAAGDDTVEAVAIDDGNNRIAYAGISDGAVTKVLFSLSDRDGNLDNNFGGDGRVAIDVGAAAVGDVEIQGVIIDAAGIVAIGKLTTAGNDDVLAVRVDLTGALDVAFGGGDGIATFDDLEAAGNVQQDEGNSALLNGANIFIARSSTFDGATFRAGILVIDAATGAEVNNFSSDADNSTGLDAAVDSGGNIFGVGARAAGSQVFKMDAAGTLDVAFGGGDGIVDVANANFQTVVVDADDNVVIGGRDIQTTDSFLVRRLGVDGEIDPTFNPDGNGNGQDLVFEPKIGADNQFVEDVFLRGTDIAVVGGATAAGDVLGFIVLLNAAGVQQFAFETEGLISQDNINEDLRQGVVDGGTNRIIGVGAALEVDNDGFDGVAVRILDD
ncbi:hypothetical protein [Candidatus Uabimicrobium sp. HlEnr_7]|uniref:hypothetical protein n=1 Tax=Candidatus Uabimicrobium helgolandensis TaxID=3095367 RepID=UPI00355645A1